MHVVKALVYKVRASVVNWLDYCPLTPDVAGETLSKHTLM